MLSSQEIDQLYRAAMTEDRNQQIREGVPERELWQPEQDRMSPVVSAALRRHRCPSCGGVE